MIKIACEYPQNKKMKNGLNNVLKYNKCNSFKKKIQNTTYQKEHNLNPNCL